MLPKLVLECIDKISSTTPPTQICVRTSVLAFCWGSPYTPQGGETLFGWAVFFWPSKMLQLCTKPTWLTEECTRCRLPPMNKMARARAYPRSMIAPRQPNLQTLHNTLYMQFHKIPPILSFRRAALFLQCSSKA